ncbi:MAG: PQQ-binding-like beta-propeller repeat protein [Verrucomicrobia bacterium]|nr:PQQ-binding-like beta-propeller repeat protein [Verrucomicrobiota bacterium]
MNISARPLSAPAALRRLVLPLVIVATAVALAEPVPLNNGHIVNGDVSNVTARGFDVKLPYGAAKYSWSQIDLRRLPSVNSRLFQSYCVATGYQPPAAPAPVARPAVAPPTAAPAAAPQAATALPAEWPCFRGPNHDGKSPDKGLLKQWPEDGPPLLWKVDTLGKGFSSATVSGGAIYITGEDGGDLSLFAFDMDGKQKWKVNSGGICKNVSGARSSPTVDGANVYLLSGDGLLGCYDAKTGTKKWTHQASASGGSPGGWGYAESVLILGKLAIFKPGGKNCIVAFDKTSGTKVWSSKGFSAGPEYGSCLPFTFGNVPMLVTGTKAGLVCVNATNGEMLWQNPFSANNTANCPTPAYSDGHVFWANGYGKGGICMKLEAGGKATEAWTTMDMVCHHGGYVIQDGCIYGNNNNGWACLDLKSGEKKWFQQAVGKGSLCWADGMLYLFSETAGRAALATCSPQGLEMKGRVQVAGSGPSWAHPVVIGGRLYLRYDTNLYCYDVRAK